MAAFSTAGSVEPVQIIHDDGFRGTIKTEAQINEKKEVVRLQQVNFLDGLISGFAPSYVLANFIVKRLVTKMDTAEAQLFERGERV